MDITSIKTGQQIYIHIIYGITGQTTGHQYTVLLAFVVGGLGFEFCVFVAGWRHALRSEWPPFIIIITGHKCTVLLAIDGNTDH